MRSACSSLVRWSIENSCCDSLLHKSYNGLNSGETASEGDVDSMSSKTIQKRTRFASLLSICFNFGFVSFRHVLHGFVYLRNHILHYTTFIQSQFYIPTLDSALRQTQFSIIHSLIPFLAPTSIAFIMFNPYTRNSLIVQIASFRYQLSHSTFTYLLHTDVVTLKTCSSLLSNASKYPRNVQVEVGYTVLLYTANSRIEEENRS